MDHEDASICLHFLLHELADPDQDLAVQQFDNLQFTLFPKLPPELRRMIWTRALPKPQRVCLYVCWCHYQQPNNRPLPATLHINQESRLVTLENYVVTISSPAEATNPTSIDDTDKLEDTPVNSGRPRDDKNTELSAVEPEDLEFEEVSDKILLAGRLLTCFDPIRDTLYLDIRIPMDLEFKKKMDQLQAAYPQKFNQVESIELINASPESLYIGARTYFPDDVFKLPAWTLAFFPSLVKLDLLHGSCWREIVIGKFIRDTYSGMHGDLSKEEVDAQFIYGLTRLIKVGMKKFGEGSIPKISFKD